MDSHPHFPIEAAQPVLHRGVLMKKACALSLLAILAIQLAACSTPEQRKAREERWAREDAERDREMAHRDRELDERDFQDFLRDYAHDLGKAPSELTAAERADARREFEHGGYHSWRHHYWY